MSAFRVLVACAATAVINVQALITTSELASLKAAIVSEFALVPSYGTVCEACASGDSIGGLLRLAFHDAAGGGGRANGCIDFSTPDNNGLQTSTSKLLAAWTPFSSQISFAGMFRGDRSSRLTQALTTCVQYQSF